MRNPRIDFFDRTLATTKQASSSFLDKKSVDSHFAFFNTLPNHLIEVCILSRLNLKSIFAFALTCKFSKRVVDNFIANYKNGDIEVQTYRALTIGKPSTIDLDRVSEMAQTKLRNIAQNENAPDHVWNQEFYIRVLAWFVIQEKIISEQEMWVYQVLTAENLGNLTQDQVTSILKTRLFRYVQNQLKARDPSVIRDRAVPDNVMSQLFYLEMLSFVQENPIEKIAYQTLTADSPERIDKKQLSAIMKTKVYEYAQWMIKFIQRCPYKVMSQMFHIEQFYFMYMEEVAHKALIAETPGAIKENEAAAIVKTKVFQCAYVQVEKGLCLDEVADQVFYIRLLSCAQENANERMAYKALIAEMMMNYSDIRLITKTRAFSYASTMQKFYPKIRDRIFNLMALDIANENPEELMVYEMLTCENPAEIDQNKISSISKSKLLWRANSILGSDGSCPERVADRLRYIALINRIREAQEKNRLSSSQTSGPVVVEIEPKNRPKDMRGLDLSQVNLKDFSPMSRSGISLMWQKKEIDNPQKDDKKIELHDLIRIEAVAYQMLIAKTPAVIKEDETAAITNTKAFECARARVEQGLCLDEVADQVLHIEMLSFMQDKAEERIAYQALIAETPMIINHRDALLILKTNVFSCARSKQKYYPKIRDQVFYITGLCIAKENSEELMVQKMLTCENPAEIDQSKVSAISKTNVFLFAKKQMGDPEVCPEKVADRVRYIELVDKVQKARQEISSGRFRYENLDESRMLDQVRKDRIFHQAVSSSRNHSPHSLVVEIKLKDRPKDTRGLDLSNVTLTVPPPVFRCGTGLMRQREELPSIQIGGKTRYGVAPVTNNEHQIFRDFKK